MSLRHCTQESLPPNSYTSTFCCLQVPSNTINRLSIVLEFSSQTYHDTESRINLFCVGKSKNLLQFREETYECLSRINNNVKLIIFGDLFDLSTIFRCQLCGTFSSILFFLTEKLILSRDLVNSKVRIVFHYQAVCWKWTIGYHEHSHLRCTISCTLFLVAGSPSIYPENLFDCCCLNWISSTITVIFLSSTFCYIIPILQSYEVYIRVLLCCILPAFCVSFIGILWNSNIRMSLLSHDKELLLYHCGVIWNIKLFCPFNVELCVIRTRQ